MGNHAHTAAQPTLAQRVAGEDLARGDFVAVLHEAVEFPSFFWECDAYARPPHETVVVRVRPQDAGRPLRVLDACLPFVFVEQPCGGCRTLDIRLLELVRLDRKYAKGVWKRLAACSQRSGRRKKKR